jgi:hypothetical protein
LEEETPLDIAMALGVGLALLSAVCAWITLDYGGPRLWPRKAPRSSRRRRVLSR